MADKCAICGKEIQESFLSKIKGTYVKTNNGLKKVCSECQTKYKDKLKNHL